MRSILLLFVLMNFYYLTAFSQDKSWEWSIQSFSACQNMAFDMVIDDVNNCYLSGIYDSGEFHIGDSVFSGQDGDFRSFISSFDREGNFRWAVSLQKEPEGTFGMVSDCYLAVDSQQNLYVTGKFDFSIDFGDTILYSLGYWDVFISKYDSLGQFVWAYHVGGPSVEQISDIKIDDQDIIYVALSHSRPSFDNYAVFGDNDTTVYFHNACASVLSLHTDATFSWLSCGTSYTEVITDDLVLDKENQLYAHFFIFDEFIFNGDTITDDLEPYTHLVVPYDATGKPGEYRKFSQYWVLDMVIDSQGDFITTGVIDEPIIILGDTLNPGHYDQLLVKYDHQMEPKWYITFPNSSSMLDFVLDLDRDDGIYISAPFEGDLALGDTILQSIGTMASFIAKLDPSGNLNWAVTVQGTNFHYTSALNLDHCGNILIGGGFNGELYLGADTLSSAQDFPEVFIAKLSNGMGFLSLGNDTVACGSLLLSAPQGYHYYSWNNGASYEDHFMADETGSYSLLAIDEHFCTDADTIFVEIKPLPQVDLGNDTLIFISDILNFSVDPQTDSILWSDGSTGTDFLFRAVDYGEGIHTVWVQLDENGCDNADSISIHVVDNSSLDEQTLIIDNLYPNPAKDKLYFDLSYKGLKNNTALTVEIFDLKGQLLLSGLVNNLDGNNHPGYVLDISTLTGGMYFLLLKDDRKVIAEKKFVVFE